MPSVDDADGYLREHGLVDYHSTARQDAAIVPNDVDSSKIQIKLIV
jgi:hypothetical protein